MRRVLILLFAASAWLGAADAAFAQANVQRELDLSAANQCNVLGVAGMGTGAVQVTGTYVGTITWNVSVTGTYVAVDAFPPDDPGTAANSTTSTGVWTMSLAGLRSIRACMSSYTSGTAHVVLSAAATGGGGGGGGAAGSNAAAGNTAAAVPASASYTAVNVGGNLTGVTGTGTSMNVACTTGCSSTAATSGTLQNAATASGNGSTLDVAGQSTLTLTVNCSSCAGGTTVNFEATEDGTNYIAVAGGRVGTTTYAATVTTAGFTYWQFSIGSLQTFRARISAYSAGTITVTGHASGAAVPTIIGVSGNVGQSGAPWSFTGSGTAGSAATGVITAQGIASMTPFLVNPGTASLFGVFAEDLAHTNADAGMFVFGIRRDTTPSSSAGAAGDYTAFSIDANGRTYTNSSIYTPLGDSAMNDTADAVKVLNVDATGATITADTQGTDDTALGTITSITGGVWGGYANSSAPTNVTAGDWTVGWFDLAGRVHVTGDASMTALLVNPGTAANWGVYVEDAGETAGGNLMMAGSVRRDTAASSAGTTGDNATINTDATGNLWTRDSTLLANMVAHDAVDAGNPLKIGFHATTSISARTMVASDDRADGFAGIDGVAIFREHANLEDRVSGVAAVTDGSSTSLVASQGAGIRFCATTLIVSNSSATNVTVDIRDGTAGSVIATIPAAANMGGAVIPLAVPLCTTAATAMAVDPSAAASTVTTTAIGFKTKL